MQPRDISAGRFDTCSGRRPRRDLRQLPAILATAPLFHHGINAADFQAAQFAEALEPWIGHVGAALFALGIFEAGIVAAIAISTSSAYAFGEVFQTGHSLNRPLREAWPFYLTLLGSAAFAAALVLIPRFPLEYIVLTVNVIAVLAMPPALAFLLLARERPGVDGRARKRNVGERSRRGDHDISDRRGNWFCGRHSFSGVVRRRSDCRLNWHCEMKSYLEAKSGIGKQSAGPNGVPPESPVVAGAAKPDIKDPRVVLSLLETDQVVAANGNPVSGAARCRPESKCCSGGFAATS